MEHPGTTGFLKKGGNPYGYKYDQRSDYKQADSIYEKNITEVVFDGFHSIDQSMGSIPCIISH